MEMHVTMSDQLTVVYKEEAQSNDSMNTMMTNSATGLSQFAQQTVAHLDQQHDSGIFHFAQSIT